jgi:hypothetical protein
MKDPMIFHWCLVVEWKLLLGDAALAGVDGLQEVAVDVVRACTALVASLSSRGARQGWKPFRSTTSNFFAILNVKQSESS